MSGLARLWCLLTDAPTAVLEPGRRRQIQLLSGLLLVLITLGLLSISVQLLVFPGSWPTFAAVSAALLLLAMAYGLARTGRFTAGALLTVGTSALTCFAIVILNPHDPIAYAFLNVSMFLARLLFDRTGVWVTTLANLLGVTLLLPVLGLPPPGDDPVVVPIFLIITAALLLVGARYREAVERDRLAELVASEEFAAGLIGNAPVIILVLDRDARIVRVNRYFEQLSGYRADEVVGRDWFDTLLPERDRARIRALFSTARAGTSTRGNVNPIVTRAGAERDIEWSDSLLRDAAGNVTGVLAIGQDVTDRRRAEEQILQLNRLLRTVTEIDQMVVRERSSERLLAETCRILVAQAGYRMAWIGLADMENGRVRPVAHAGFEAGYLDQAGIRCDDSPYGQGPTGTAIRENRYVINNDSRLEEFFAPWREQALQLGYRSTAAFPLRVGGRVIGAINVYAGHPGAFGQEEIALLGELAEDLGHALHGLEVAAARERAETALAQSESNYRALTENANVGILVNYRGQHVVANNRLLAMLGYTAEEFRLTGGKELVHPLEYDKVMERFRARMAGESAPSVYETVFMTKDRQAVPVELTVAKTIWQGEPAGLVFLHDIRDRKQAEHALRERNALLENMFASMHAMVAYLDPQFNFIRVNRAYAEDEGLTPEFFVGKNHFDLYSNAENRAIFQNVVDSGEPYVTYARPFDFGERAGRGLTYWDWSLTPVRADGRVTGLVLVLVDVTGRLKTEEQMRKLSSALEQTADSVIITNRDGVIEYVNLGFEKITGYGRDEALGQTPRLVKSGKQGAGFYKKLWDTVLAGDVFSEVFVNRRKDGSLYYEEKTISPLKGPAGQVTHFVATGKDVTERMQAQERLQHMAQHDALTELPNRVLFLDRLKQAVARARWHERLVAVLFVDMDRFKTINDTLGHEVGDKLLQALAERFTASVREGDTVARFGGDEFVVLLDDVASEKDIGVVAQKVLEALAPPFAIDGQDLYITASIGVSLYPNDGEDSTTLLKHADIAMYRAKDLGKNTYQFYSADMSARAFERLTLESSLRHAIERNEFRLYYQPQIDTASGAILGVEALLRWQHPDFGLVSPAEFIPLLEETGLIVPAGDWVLRTACEQLRAWHAAGWPQLRMAVNLSPRQFQTAGLAQSVERVLSTLGCDPGLLELEITESVLLRHTATTLETLEALHALGVRMAIDDFGTGYSSLSYLRRYSIDTLKIDRSFVHDVPDDADDSALASAIIVLAQSLKLDVIAEGVETEAQRDFLRARGCHQMQGYLFSRPLPAEDITRLLEKAGLQMYTDERGRKN